MPADRPLYSLTLWRPWDWAITRAPEGGPVSPARLGGGRPGADRAAPAMPGRPTALASAGGAGPSVLEVGPPPGGGPPLLPLPFSPSLRDLTLPFRALGLYVDMLRLLRRCKHA